MVQPADPHLAEQMRAAVRCFLPQRSKSHSALSVRVDDLQFPDDELSQYRDQILVLDSWLGEEMSKADDGHRAPDEAAVLAEILGLIGLRIAANPGGESSISSPGDLLPILAQDQHPTFGSAQSPARLLALGWEAAIVRAFLARLARQIRFPAQDPIAQPRDLPRSTARSTLAWITGNAIECALQDPARGRIQAPERALWSPFDLSPGPDLSALVIYRRDPNPERLVQILAERIAECTTRSPSEVEAGLLALARDAANGFSREELSQGLGKLLVRPRARAVRFT